MKTASVLICIAIVAAMAVPAKAALQSSQIIDLEVMYGFIVPDDGGDDLFVNDTIIPPDNFTDTDGNEYIVLYDMEYDCLLCLGPAPMRPYGATDINMETRVRKQMQIIKIPYVPVR
jgi:hypothetical protein